MWCVSVVCMLCVRCVLLSVVCCCVLLSVMSVVCLLCAAICCVCCVLLSVVCRVVCCCLLCVTIYCVSVVCDYLLCVTICCVSVVCDYLLCLLGGLPWWGPLLAVWFLGFCVVLVPSCLRLADAVVPRDCWVVVSGRSRVKERSEGAERRSWVEGAEWRSREEELYYELPCPSPIPSSQQDCWAVLPGVQTRPQWRIYDLPGQKMMYFRSAAFHWLNSALITIKRGSWSKEKHIYTTTTTAATTATASPPLCSQPPR